MSQISKQALIVDNSQSFPNNNVGDITPADLRAFNVNMIDSLVNEIPYQSFTASVTNSINLLNQFSASQQPTFNALNSFTASQLVLNTGYNAATYSLDVRLDSAEANLTNLNTWSQSVNQISDNGIVQGYSTRLHFYGLVSASIVPNVNGAIASINIEQDGTKLNTSSFNSYTASTNQRIDSLEVWSGSARISIAALNAFTQSVGPIQTGSLLLTSSFSGDKLTFTKGNATTYVNAGIQNTASFNSYTASINAFTASNGNTSLNAFTASQNTKNTTLENVTASLQAYTASTNLVITNLNAFTASQNTKNATLAPITASLLASQSAYDVKWQTLSGQTASIYSATASLNTFTASIAGTNEFTASINTYTASNNTKWTTIGLLTGSYATTGSNDFKATQIITGSVRGNVNTLSIAGNTASMDLATSNFFKLNLVSGSTTSLSASNIQPGQTINVLVTQPAVGTGSIAFNSVYKFPYGFDYTASLVSNAQDILTMIAFDSASLYSVAVKQLS